MAASHDKKPDLAERGSIDESSPQQPEAGLDPGQAFDLDDFDDEFDDDFEAEVAGEYEIEDDEFARQLVENLDFEIEGLMDLDEDDDDSSFGKSSDESDDDQDPA